MNLRFSHLNFFLVTNNIIEEVDETKPWLQAARKHYQSLQQFIFCDITNNQPILLMLLKKISK